MSRKSSALANTTTAPMTDEIASRVKAMQEGRHREITQQQVRGVEFMLAPDDELELTKLMKDAFPSIRFFDVGARVGVERSMATIEVKTLSEHPNQKLDKIWQKSMIEIIWPVEGWRPDFEPNQRGEPVLRHHQPYFAIYHPKARLATLNGYYDFPDDYLERFQQALIRGGATPPRTYRQRRGETMGRAYSRVGGELHVYSFPDIPESAAFGRKMLRLAKKVCPHYLYRVNPVTGEVGEKVERSTSGWFGKGLAERFRQDPNFWPKIWIPPKEYCDNPDELLEVWVPETCLPDNDPLAFRD